MNKIALLSVFLVLNARNQDSATEPGLTGPYLGQSEPGDKLELFAPGIFSDGLHNRDIAITPDGQEIYTTVSWGRDSFSKIVVTLAGRSSRRLIR